ncbi:neutral zinc metallopeptidase [Kribbella solani]|uniref:neutral zinc metallopeptidase n=1 Tax=Kribbella solani TaxID=236067 RepID=UPI0029B54140|nr:neutral zinc metallopeptidase [Kribbella solani]MDX2969645.1 neutral zinc metallopeptidase [Kribbella solani]MDX3003268.1 neutral zinc metallopeptidase [Kribbella solani]
MNPRALLASCAAAVILLTGCTPKSSTSDADAAAASEVAKAREAMPTTTSDTPGADSTAPVSAPPMPATLVNNPIYRVGPLPSARCAEPAYEPTSLANVRAYFTQYLACLNKAWAPVIRKAGFTFTEPKLVVVLGQSPSSPCTVDDGRDYYCGGTIYMDAATHLDIAKDDPDWARAWMALEIGHEYGHHVQALTGILTALYKHDQTLNGVEAQLEGTRRMELQASCFSGAYIGADRYYFPVTPDWLVVWRKAILDTIDTEHDHGKGANHARWTTAGFDAATPAACNTYTAASSLVG